MLRHGSLFSGIGGFDIASSWMGWQNVFSCEKDPFCRNILKHYWPNTTHYENIYNFNATEFRGNIDIISGGFPCQPFSQAGRRRGTKDDRYLFPETIRIIKQVRPEWIVLENVAGLFTILEQESLSEMEVQAIELFCTDNDQKASPTIIRLQRRVIGQIISEIGSAGYVLPALEDGTPVILCIPAAAVNAPHRRDRVWFVAHAKHDSDRADYNQSADPADCGADDERRDAKTAFDQGCTYYHGSRERTDTCDYYKRQQDCNCKDDIYTGRRWKYSQCNTQKIDSFATSANGIWCNETEKPPADQYGYNEIPKWDDWPTESPVFGRNDGLPERLDRITFPAWRTDSIKAYGNAIVPQVALEIFRAIQSVSLNHKAS